MPRRARSPRKRGGALVIALALLALAAALLAGSAQLGRASMRSAQSQSASITADAEARRALAEFVAGWSPAYDSIAVGAWQQARIEPRAVGASGLEGFTRLRILRISNRRFVVGVETTIGSSRFTSARRRLSLIIDRRPASDTSAAMLPPAPIRQWSLADLF